MVSELERRRIRIANDHTSMRNIVRDWLQWRAVSGVAPYVEAYELKLKVRAIIDPKPLYRNDHVVSIVIPVTYPAAPPQARMITSPPPFHPNWYVDGRWCSGQWEADEGLGEFVVRLIQTLQYNRYITNEASPANGPARDWYLRNIKSGLFPCDATPLPDPSTGLLRIVTPNSPQPNSPPRFRIKKTT
jgi:ubiquitin-protein ligase